MDVEENVVPQNARLIVESGDDEGKSFELTNKTMTLGRAEVCDIRLSDRYVSNKHCQVVFRKDHFTVIDLNSLNKTKVHDQVYIQKNLRNGDFITLGKTKIRFVWEDQNEEQVNPSEDILGEDEGTEPQTTGE